MTEIWMLFSQYLLWCISLGALAPEPPTTSKTTLPTAATVLEQIADFDDISTQLSQEAADSQIIALNRKIADLEKLYFCNIFY